MKLSILIPSLISRADSLNSLRTELNRQAMEYVNEVEILTSVDNGENSIGYKRNDLLNRAKGDYICFVDDDDWVVRNYISLLMEGIEKDVDCCSLIGVYTTDGENPELFEHSIKYTEWKTAAPSNGIRYERPPNHLNCIRASIAKKIGFPLTYHGEDHHWSNQLQKSGLIKTEHTIIDILYHYKFKSKK